VGLGRDWVVDGADADTMGRRLDQMDGQHFVNRGQGRLANLQARHSITVDF
jgi:hypothetical protein